MISEQVASLKELLEQSDVISLHCPLVHNEVNNKHLINKVFIYLPYPSFLFRIYYQ